MLVLVCGSRDFTDPFRASLAIDMVIGRLVPGDVVIHGAARGSDQIAAESATRRGLTVRAFPADWKRHGKRAGIIRNLEMLAQQPDVVVAFWNGSSPGTAHMIREARKRGITVSVVPL